MAAAAAAAVVFASYGMTVMVNAVVHLQSNAKLGYIIVRSKA